jgi:hypothetical protein
LCSHKSTSLWEDSSVVERLDVSACKLSFSIRSGVTWRRVYTGLRSMMREMASIDPLRRLRITIMFQIYSLEQQFKQTQNKFLENQNPS